MSAIDALVRAYGPRLMGLVHRLLGDRGRAEDVWQETWGSIWQAAPRWKRDADPWPYIRRAALARISDLMRREARRPRLVTGIEAPEAPRSGAAAWPAAADVPAIDLAALPQHERAALVLFFWEGLSVAEIAEALAVPPNTVKTWMSRGRERLRAAILSRKEAP